MANPIEAPKESVGDVVHSLTKGAIGVVPYVGSVASEAFALVVATPYQRRHAEWMEAVGAKLLELEGRKAGVRDELQNDPGFIDTLLQATQAAIRSSDEEKRAALRNAVMNSTSAEDRPDDSRRQMFVNMVDELTPWHLRLVILLDDPARWFEQHERTMPQFPEDTAYSHMLCDAFPEFCTF